MYLIYFGCFFRYLLLTFSEYFRQLKTMLYILRFFYHTLNLNIINIFRYINLFRIPKILWFGSDLVLVFIFWKPKF